MINPRLTSNIRTFLLALVLGTAVWVSAVSSADPNEARSYPKPVPIEIIGQDPSLVLTNEVPTNMNVTIRAPRSVWDSLNSQDNVVRAILDLSGLGAGQHIVAVKVQVAMRLTQIVRQDPRTVSVDLQSLTTKTLPLTLALNGQPAAGYQAGDATLASREATITGPTSLVKQAMRARAKLVSANARQAAVASCANASRARVTTTHRVTRRSASATTSATTKMQKAASTRAQSAWSCVATRTDC